MTLAMSSVKHASTRCMGIVIWAGCSRIKAERRSFGVGYLGDLSSVKAILVSALVKVSFEGQTRGDGAYQKSIIRNTGLELRLSNPPLSCTICSKPLKWATEAFRSRNMTLL